MKNIKLKVGVLGICICLSATFFSPVVFASNSDVSLYDSKTEMVSSEEDDSSVGSETSTISLNNDDPGNWRLSGDIPAEFYGETNYSLRTYAALPGFSYAGYTHDNRFEDYLILKGIDVSKFQGDINWSNVKADGIQYAFIRMADRGYGSAGTLAQDSYGQSNMEEAIKANIPVGAYIFSQAITEEEAIEEANYLLDSVKGYNVELPLVMDFEYSGGSEGRTGEGDIPPET